MEIAVSVLIVRCQTFNINRGPKPEARADQEKVTKLKTLSLPARAITKITVVKNQVWHSQRDVWKGEEVFPMDSLCLFCTCNFCSLNHK